MKAIWNDAGELASVVDDMGMVQGEAYLEGEDGDARMTLTAELELEDTEVLIAVTFTSAGAARSILDDLLRGLE